jgi:AcrR family transcriptional regulator
MSPTKKERTQKDILEAAKGIVHDKGHEAVTVRCLAEVTGNSYTNLYYYFKDVNALLWALRLNMIEDMIAELTSAFVSKADPVEEIISAFSLYSDYFFDHPNVFRFFYFYPFVQPVGDNGYEALEARFQGMWQTSFIRLVQEGILQPKDIEVVAKTLIYALQGMIMLSLSANGSSTKEGVKHELEIIAKNLFN